MKLVFRLHPINLIKMSIFLNIIMGGIFSSETPDERPMRRWLSVKFNLIQLAFRIPHNETETKIINQTYKSEIKKKNLEQKPSAICLPKIQEHIIPNCNSECKGLEDLGDSTVFNSALQVLGHIEELGTVEIADSLNRALISFIYCMKSKSSSASDLKNNQGLFQDNSPRKK